MRVQKGSILVYTLWILSAVSLILSLTLSDLRILNLSAGKYTERYKFLIEAHAAAKIALLQALNFSSIVGRVRVNLEKNYSIALGARKYIVRLSAEDGRYPITIDFALSSELNKLFRALGFKDFESLTDSILDFQDKDNLVRLKGAEKDYYEKFGYTPPNRKFISLEELIWVKDIDFLTYKKLKNYITVYTNRININYASKEVLIAIGFSQEQAKRIVELRKRSPVSVQEIKRIVGAKWDFLRFRISLIPLPQMYRAEVTSTQTGERVNLIITPNGKIVDILWY